MAMNMRFLLLVLLGGVAVATFAHSDPQPSAAARGRQWLLDRRAADGTWRSDVYSAFRDGPSLTPLALLALQELNDPATAVVVASGYDYLAKMVKPDGTIDAAAEGVNYPVYTAALAVRVLSRSPRHRPARDAWLAELRRRQLDEGNGWTPADAFYGGWGYCHPLPRKPKPGEVAPQLLESNLSATAYALDAFRAAGVPADDPAWRKALRFVVRCQNYSEDGTAADRKFDDGGFYFVDGDPARNKPGPLGRDAAGRERYRSYGSMTADGFRALRLCGLPTDHPRVQAAAEWLRRSFDGKGHPGAYPPERAGERDAVYFYYAWSLAQSLPDLSPGDARRMAAGLTEGIAARQRPDGSWANASKAVREDDPVLATSWALLTLARCRPFLP
jgi:squalene-hopene/tetraprenyl-beta-curcumene cyclase